MNAKMKISEAKGTAKNCNKYPQQRMEQAQHILRKYGMKLEEEVWNGVKWVADGGEMTYTLVKVLYDEYGILI